MDVLDDWVRHLRASGRSMGTVEHYRPCLSRLEREQGVVLEATRDHLVAFLSQRADHPPTQHLHLKAFRSFYRWARESGLLQDDPTIGLRPPKIPLPPVDAYSPEELRAIVEAAGRRSELRRWAILACYGLGLRRREMARLTPEDVDFERRRVHIRQSKGGKSRWVEMSTVAEEALHRLEPWWNGTVIGSLKPTTFSRWVSQAAEDAGLPPGRRRAHMLRSAYVTELLEAGARIEVVQQEVGHSTIATTQRYVKISQHARVATVAMLPRVG